MVLVGGGGGRAIRGERDDFGINVGVGGTAIFLGLLHGVAAWLGWKPFCELTSPKGPRTQIIGF